MWLLAQLDSAEPTYHIAWALWLEGELRPAALQQAWQAVLARHESLRTSFRDVAGVPAQVVDDEPVLQALTIRQPLAAAGHTTQAKQDAAARRFVAELAATPFDLAAGPPIRAELVRLGPQRHVLALVLHHIVADGWSCRVLFEDLAADYAAIADGGAPVTVQGAIQYPDFAIWQVNRAETGGYAAAERFWQEALAGAPSGLQLPPGPPQASRQGPAAATVSATIDAGLTARLRQLAAAHGVTLFSVLLAGYAVLLARLTGARDLVIAVPVAARTQPETERLVGLLVNTIPVRVRVGPGAELGELVRSVHAAVAGALEHQELPFPRIVELARPERDPARLPLAQVMFSMEEPWTVPDHGGPRWRPELISTGTTKFEIELSVTGDRDGLVVRARYSTGAVDPGSGRIVARGFTQALRYLADYPSRAVRDVDILPPASHRLLTRSWPDGGQLPTVPQPVVERLWQACGHERAIAEAGDGIMRGTELRCRALAVATALHGLGVQVTDRVAVLVPRGTQILPVLLGIWLAGGCYLPLDPSSPPQRLEALLRDAQPVALVVHSGVAGAPRAPAASPPMAVLDVARLPGEVSEGEALTPRSLPGSTPAYMMYTSGSAGLPKAVSVPHHALAALLDAVASILALRPADRLVAVSSFAFDISMVELLAPLLAGACVVIADSSQVTDPGALRDLLASSGATALQATPTGWRLLMTAGSVPSAVRLRLTAGEPLPRDLADEIGTGPGVSLWNLYGPTEATIYAGGALVPPAPSPIEIGPVIGGTQLYLLDDLLRPVPPGVLGEVCVGGAGVALGYHNAPGLTAQRFVPDPFSRTAGARMYRTGDLGRWRGPGRIELAGRVDRQVKIRGHRVECGEVEAALRTHPDVAEAAVTVRGDGSDATLAGYLVTRSRDLVVPRGLREHLKRLLPDYMVPAAVVVVRGLPLTASGKTDYRALPEPGEDGAQGWPAADLAGPAARTPVEQRLVSIFMELLQLSELPGAAENFFSLGGHSLTAVQLVARIRAELGADLPMRVLFADPTVAALAAAVEAAAPGTDESHKPARRDRSQAEQRGAAENLAKNLGVERFPLSFAQEQLWFVDQLSRQEITYTMPFTVWLDGPLRLTALQRALRALVARHGALRCSITADSAVPAQVVADIAEVPLERVSLPAELDGSEFARRAKALADGQTRVPFDLARGPLVRVMLVSAGPNRHMLLLVLHHIIGDGPSVRILFGELAALYRAELTGRPAGLPPLSMSYGDFAVWQRDRVRGEWLRRRLSRWHQRLDGAPTVLTLPGAWPRPPLASSLGAQARATLPAAAARRLAALARDHNATVVMALLTGYALVLSRYAGQPDLIIGLPAVARTHAELEPIVGMFTNILPIRVRTDGAGSFAELLGQVRDAVAEALEDQEVPFSALVEEFAGTRSLGHAPLVQVQFAYGSLTPPDLALPDVTARGEVLFTGTAKLDLTLFADATPAKATRLVLEYRSDLFDHRWAAGFLRRLIEVLSTCSADAPVGHHYS